MIPPKPPDEFEIQTEGSTLDRFMNLTRRLLGVNRDELRVKENEYKAERQQKRAAKRKSAKVIKS
jgi:hypothetical protein